MVNPERKPDMGALREKIKETKEAKAKTDLQKDYKEIANLMKDLESPAPGMDQKLAQEKERVYAKLNIPQEASLETAKLAYGQAVAAERAMNTSEAAREAFQEVGIESPYRIAKVSLEFNVLADEVGDIQESGLGMMDISQEVQDKLKRFEKVNEEWTDIAEVMQEFVTDKSDLGSLGFESRSAKVVGKRKQGEKSPAGMTPTR